MSYTELKKYTVEELAKMWNFYVKEPANKQANEIASDIYHHACLFRPYEQWERFFRLICNF